MGTPPKVSVIIPAYNSECYLRETLGSLQAQSLVSWQAVIVDDTSTDNTVALARELAEEDARIEVFASAVNMGQNVSRNVGLSLAKGEFIKFLDHDDLLPPWALSTQVDQIESQAADLVIGSIRRFEDKPEGLAEAHAWFREGAPKRSEDEERLVEDPLDALAATTPTFNEILIKRALIVQAGFNRYLGTGEELDVFGSFSINTPKMKIVVAKDPWVVAKRVMDDSLGAQYMRVSQTGKNWGLLSLQAVAERILESEKPISASQRKHVFDRLYPFAAYAYRDGREGCALTAHRTWSLAKLPRPDFGIPLHDRLHALLGFSAAESLLARIRKLRNLVTPSS